MASTARPVSSGLFQPAAAPVQPLAISEVWGDMKHQICRTVADLPRQQANISHENIVRMFPGLVSVVESRVYLESDPDHAMKVSALVEWNSLRKLHSSVI
jgi:hypothetical protein